MRTRPLRWKMTAMLLGASVLFAACSPSVTESDEYLALVEERDRVERERDQARTEASETRSDLESTEAELADSEARVTELEQELAAATDALLAAQAENGAPSGEPWPESVKTVFVDSCAEDPDPDISPEQQRDLCVCITEELEQRVSLSDFLAFSVGVFAGNPDAPPEGIDEEFITVLTEASVSCALSLGVFF